MEFNELLRIVFFLSIKVVAKVKVVAAAVRFMLIRRGNNIWFNVHIDIW